MKKLLTAIQITLSYDLNAKHKEHLLAKKVCGGSQTKCPIGLMSWKNVKTGAVSLLKL
jgi:hypothetical protein